MTWLTTPRPYAPAALLAVLLAWMVLVASACGLVYLTLDEAPPSTPRRTRPPVQYPQV